MGIISTLARLAWRDYNTDGVPASGAHEPEKQAIREVMDEVDAQAENAVTLDGAQTITGRKTMSGGIAGLPAPVADSDAARKVDVDSAALAVTWNALGADLATTTALPACTYANGAAGVGATLTGNANGALADQDGETPAVNDRILVKNQAAALQNGIYVVTTVGSGGAPFVLTRAADHDAAAEIGRVVVAITGGDTLSGHQYVCELEAADIAIGTTALPFTLFASAPSFTAVNARIADIETMIVPTAIAAHEKAALEHFVFERIDFLGRRTLAGVVDDIADIESGPATPTRIKLGDVKHDSVLVMHDIDGGSGDSLLQLVLSVNEGFSTVDYESANERLPCETVKQDVLVWRSFLWRPTGLAAGTVYYGRWRIDGILEAENRFQFRTMPDPVAAASFWFLFYSCTRGGSDTVLPAFRSMLADAVANAAQFAINAGDAGYPNPTTDDVTFQRANCIRKFATRADVPALLEYLPHFYIYSDHDSGPNSGHHDQAIPGTTFGNVVEATQQQLLEVWPLADLWFPAADRVEEPGGTTAFEPGTPSDPDVPGDRWVISQEPANLTNQAAWILLDQRSARQYASLAAANKTVIGNGTEPAGYPDQRTKLRTQILAAGAAGKSVVHLIMEVCFHGGADGWFIDAPTECTAFADWLRDTVGAPQVIMWCGEIHRVGFDSGANTDKATGGGLTVPQFAISAAHRGVGADDIEFHWRGDRAVAMGADALSATPNRGNNYALVQQKSTGHVRVIGKGNPYTGDAASTLETPLGFTMDVSTDEVGPAISFAQATIGASDGVPVNLPVVKHEAGAATRPWFGPIGPVDNVDGASAYIDWDTNEAAPQGNTLPIRPNCGRYNITITFPLTGTFVVTLSNPTAGLAVGAQSTITVTVT